MYQFFDPNCIKPQGWLKQQLQIQASGLSGSLDQIWPDIRDSAWIGGSREGWERVPYWLDGIIPLGRLLHDDALIARVDRYVFAIIDRQQSDGWICPGDDTCRANYDAWAVLLIGKVLALHYSFSKEERVLTALYRSMKCFAALLENGTLHLFDWGKFRWFEGLIPLSLLWEQYHENWIRELAVTLQRQGADYPSFADSWKRPINQWTFHTHIVNLCMMFKYEALCHELLDQPDTGMAEQLWQLLEQYNGTAVGTFTGDECLSGTANNQGTELCSIVELMYCCELLYRSTGDSIWADRLEKIAFNALPAAFTDDMWAHQYDQMANQIACVTFPGRSQFRTNGPDAHLFGLEPHFGCCTANFSQGWPKLAMNLFLKSASGIHIPYLLPGKLCTEINGAAVEISIRTGYPFEHSGIITVTATAPVRFTLSMRIPGWAEECSVDGIPCREIRITEEWTGCRSITVQFSAKPKLCPRPRGLMAAEYGPLVFALPIKAEYRKLEYARDGVERKFPYCDYELYPQSEWRYGFASEVLIPELRQGDSIPFSSLAPRLVLKARLCPADWDFAEGFDTVAERVPASLQAMGEDQDMILYPYGCAKLRMTEMPLLR